MSRSFETTVVSPPDGAKSHCSDVHGILAVIMSTIFFHNIKVNGSLLIFGSFRVSLIIHVFPILCQILPTEEFNSK